MLPAGLAALPVPRDSTPLRDGRGMLTLRVAVPSAGCPGGSVPHMVLAVGSVRVEPCARRQRQTDTERVPGRGRRGPWTRLSLCVGCRGAWSRRGAAPVSLLRLMPAISELLARVRAELEMSGTAAG